MCDSNYPHEACSFKLYDVSCYIRGSFCHIKFQEAAFDADKVFLAAIDKFDAMMSKGNVYAPEGMFSRLAALIKYHRSTH